MLFGVDDHVAGLELALLTESKEIIERICVDTGTVIKVLGMSRGQDRDRVGGILGLQEKGIPLAG